MIISEVSSPADHEAFLRLPLSIYKDNPDWIQPLRKDIEAVFDPKQNKFFKHGECTRFLLKENDKVIGRIAVFINKRTAAKEEQPAGGIGFFDCINDKKAAHLLFDQCKRWLAERGMEAMDGPVNFGERDSWWGLIVEGFSPPLYKMNFNPPYYRELFESYGFQTYFEQWCYSLVVRNRIEEKFYTRHLNVAADPAYRAEHLKKNRLDKYAEDFRAIYNKAWARHGSGKELDSRQVQMLFKKMKPIIDERLMWYVYYNDEPVGMWINLPDINQIFRKFNGRFGLIEKLRFLIQFKLNRITKIVGLVFGIVPEHQGKGLDAYMIVEGAKVLQNKTQYTDFEMQWIGDFNPKMVSIAEHLGTTRTRVLKTYRYLFDRQKEFKRHPIL